MVFLKKGRFGPYVQLGEGEAPKRSSLPKAWEPSSLDLERALKLLSLPREVGPHPEDQEMILAGLGRYGPYVQKGRIYANLPGIDDVFEIGLNRAVAVLDEKKSGKAFGRGKGPPPPVKELGPHPDDEAPVNVMSGRYGPYIAWNRVFANVPKNVQPTDVTLDMALPLLAKKLEAGGGKAKPAKKAAKPKAEKPVTEKKPPAKKAAAAKTPAKKTNAKPAAKKSAAKK
jgi:DNA topoisomerase-1